MTSTDVFVLLLSGHGYIQGHTGNNAVFMANDYDKLEPATYLDYKTEIEAPLKRVKGQKLVFIDACQGYNEDPPVAKNNTKLDDRVSSAWANIVSEGPSYRALLSCSRGQLSYEDTVNLKHGAFTYALLEAFKNTKVRVYDAGYEEYQANLSDIDEQPDQFLTFKELAHFVKKRVPTLWKKIKNAKSQTPLVYDDGKQDIPIFWFEK